MTKDQTESIYDAVKAKLNNEWKDSVQTINNLHEDAFREIQEKFHFEDKNTMELQGKKV
jgi:hypothetical protein